MNAGRYVYEELLLKAKKRDAEGFRTRLEKFNRRYPQDLQLADISQRIVDVDLEEEVLEALESELEELVACHTLESGGGSRELPMRERRKFASSLANKREDE